ncbi:MAG: hypothetical protein AB1403_19680 [Candidatus Riflebacteria bacterium]
MKKSLVIGRQVLKSCLRSRSLSLIAFFLVALLIFMSMVTSSDSAFRTALVMDSGLSLINIFSLLLVALIIVPVYQAERDRHTMTAALSFNLSRSDYLRGLCLGTTAALLINYLIMSIILVINLMILGIPFEAGFFRQLFLNLLELLCLGSFAVAFSIFFSYVVAIMMTATIYMVGHMTTSLQMALQEWEGSFIASILGWVRMIIPDFSLFNLKDIVVKHSEIPASYEFIAIVYALSMIFIAVELARYRLNREDLM